jgi:hypothetical protein
MNAHPVVNGWTAAHLNAALTYDVTQVQADPPDLPHGWGGDGRKLTEEVNHQRSLVLNVGISASRGPVYDLAKESDHHANPVCRR